MMTMTVMIMMMLVVTFLICIRIKIRMHVIPPDRIKDHYVKNEGNVDNNLGGGVLR